jgi:hypothetical protein
MTKKHVFLGGLAIIGVLMTWLVVQSGPQPNRDKTNGGDHADAPFALIELFTSEGCSSCPPADALLGDLVKDARDRDKRVYCLAFQVDYWNNLGWTDPYSDAAYSQRQYSYAKALKSERVYTPQMIVNGTDAFVGSEKALARKSIDAALKTPAKATVQLRLDKKGDSDALTIAYETASAPAGAVLNVALVERGLAGKVLRGENAGQKLRHENVVRGFRTIRLDESGKGSVALKPPDGLVRKNASMIAYIQDADWKVLGAGAIELENGDAP